ncbi:MAG TPA: nitronate monooxygenase [Planctomycetota bacterium]
MRNTERLPLPRIIQGGLGAGVSSWRLARTVSAAGQLGVVAGTALDLILARRLQLGDADGRLRGALARLPIPGVAERILARYWIQDGKASAARFMAKPRLRLEGSAHQEELLIAANFVEVDLAREGHEGLVGINYLEKIQLPTLPSLYGAMLAGVDVVLMGAGIPIAIPGILDDLAAGRATELPLDARGAERDERFMARFDPAQYFSGAPPELARPRFLAIVSSVTVATALQRRARGEVDGFVVEGHTAGGHNAPPRGRKALTPKGEPEYGERDAVDPVAFAALGRPFWLAGSYGRPGGLAEALAAGAAGIQVGTAFAYCAESDLREDLKLAVLERSRAGEARVFTDPVASPTGFPFKVVPLPGTLTDPEVFRERPRRCDLGYLRHAYRRADGTVGWRCPAEDADEFVRKGGAPEETVGRMCVCNALAANVGLGQVLPDGSPEPALVTSGDEVATVARFLPPGARSYRAVDVLELLLGDLALAPAR